MGREHSDVCFVPLGGPQQGWHGGKGGAGSGAFKGENLPSWRGGRGANNQVAIFMRKLLLKERFLFT